MPVGNIPQKPIHSINGIKISVIEAGIRYQNRKDLVLFEICDGASVSGVFTQNKFKAAPVILCEKHLKQRTPKYLLINTGNANAGTGQKGLDDALKTCEELAKITNIKPNQILPFSTGVTADFLPTEPIIKNLPKLAKGLKTDNWNNAATGIMTTDTVPKSASVQFKIDDETITISGVTKGSGMIKPNMATMLSYIATDAKIDQKTLDKMLSQAINKSFNRITIDGDTSTNDSCVLIATGQNAVIKNKNQREFFLSKLTELMQNLAQYMVRDAEGATKFITVEVINGKTSKDCLEVAYKIAHSPLVKTAFFASDANIGRIMVAVGNAEITNMDCTKVKILVGNILTLHNGIDVDYDEEKIANIMKQDEILIKIDLRMGGCDETIWTCDLSYEYIKINADYRT